MKICVSIDSSLLYGKQPRKAVRKHATRRSAGKNDASRGTNNYYNKRSHVLPPARMRVASDGSNVIALSVTRPREYKYLSIEPVPQGRRLPERARMRDEGGGEKRHLKKGGFFFYTNRY